MTELESDKDIDGNSIENKLVRRMFQTMMLPVSKLQNKKKKTLQPKSLEQKSQLGMFSCLEMIAYSDDKGAAE